MHLADGQHDKLSSRCAAGAAIARGSWPHRLNNLMPKVRIAIIGAGESVEWEILPFLTGPELSQPSDEGAWWNRRPGIGGDIRWQPPAEVEVVAICDGEVENAQRLARSYRIAAAYGDWRTMLQETSADAIVCERAASVDFEELPARASASGVRSLWFDEPPVADFELVLHLYALAEAHGVLAWWARPLRYAAAHRAARRMINRGEIGDVTSLHLRWNTSFGGKAEMFSASNFAAIDLLLACAQSAPTEVLAREAKGITTVWISLVGGATATAVFAAADAWNAPLPRLEIIGTQGRSLICEAGRRLGMFQPRDAARWIEPPGLAAHVSSANLGGVADDLRAFIGLTIGEKMAHSPQADGREASRALQVVEAIAQSLQTGSLEIVEPLRVPTAHQRLFAAMELTEVDPSEAPGTRKSNYAPVLTLPLNL